MPHAGPAAPAARPANRRFSPATLLGLGRGRTVAATGKIDDRAAAQLTRVVAGQIEQDERAGPDYVEWVRKLVGDAGSAFEQQFEGR